MQDVIQSPEAAFVLLLAGALSLPILALRRSAIYPLAALGVAIAGLRADPGPRSLTPVGLADLPANFLHVTAGLLLLSVAAAAVIAVRARRRGLALLPGTILAASAGRGIVMAAGAGASLVAAASIAAIVAVALGIGRVLRLRRAIGALDRRWLGAPGRLPASILPGPTAALVGCTLLSLAGTHLGLVFLGAAGASWSVSWMMGRGAALPVVLTLLLAVVYLFMATVAGPEGLSIAGLASLPISPAAELLLGAAILVATWISSGLWPLHGQTLAPLAAPAGLLLLARVGLAAAPAGVEHWRALAAPVGMLALWHAGAVGWTPGAAVGAAWLALGSGATGGTAAAWWLVPAALVLELLAGGGERESAPRRLLRALALAGVAWGGLRAFEAGVRGEVVYSVLAAAGAAIACAAAGQAITASAPSAPAPSA